MLLKQIQYFVAIVDENSFTEAAEKFYISQSAVSQSIMALEKELGTKLMLRTSRKFTLTEAGQYFYRRGKALLAELDEMTNETIRLGRVEQAKLCVGYLNLYAGPELSDAIDEFVELHPEVDVSIVSGTHEELYAGLSAGTIDLALNDQRRAFSGAYRNVEVADAACLLEVSRRNEIASRDRIDLSALPKLPCILISSPEYEANEEDYYRNVFGVTGPFVFARTMEEARLMVIGNRGFLPLEAIGRLPESGAVRRVPLYQDGEQLTRKYCLFWPKSRTSPLIEEFAERFRQKLT